jgi:hypothetical protein
LITVDFLSTFLAAPQHVRAQSDAIEWWGLLYALGTKHE